MHHGHTPGLGVPHQTVAGVSSSGSGGGDAHDHYDHHGHPIHPLTATPYPMPPPPPAPKPLLVVVRNKLMKNMRTVPKIPGLLVLVLCSVSFFFGRFVQQAALLPEPAVLSQEVANPASLPGTRRTLKTLTLDNAKVMAKDINSKQAATTKAATLDAASASSAVTCSAPDPATYPDAFQTWVQNKLAASNKPVLPPGASGENFIRTASFQILSWYPRIAVYPNFIDRERADHVIKKAQQLLHPSDLAYRPGEQIELQQQVRTSTGAFLSGHGDPVMEYLEAKIAAVTFLPRNNGEAWNILNYRHHQHYDSHYDTFDPKEYGPQTSQRICTVIVYLSDVEEGGMTMFKREGRGNANKAISNWTNCEVDGGLSYQPRMGDAVVFWDVRPNGDIDPHGLHASCPITKGDKWVAVKWIRSIGDYLD